MSDRLNLFVHRKGNLYMRQIALLLRDELVGQGLDVRIVSEGVPGRGSTLDIVVAPHEYAVFEPRMYGEQGLELMSRCAAITTEQPGTEWSALGRWLISKCRVIADLSPVAADELAAEGLPAEPIGFGYTPYWDRWGGRETGGRSLDVVVLAAMTEHRERMLSLTAPVLAERRSRVLLFDNSRPVLETDPWFVHGEALLSLMRSSRSLLNIRRADDSAYFEWVRCLPAVLNGAVIVTEPSFGAAPLEPVRHFVVGRNETLPAHLTALLDDESFRQRMAADAYEAIRSVPPLAESLRRFVDRAAEALGRSVSWLPDRPVIRPVTSPEDASDISQPATTPAPGWSSYPFREPGRVEVRPDDDLASVAKRLDACESSVILLHREGDRFFPRAPAALAEVLATVDGLVAAYGPVCAEGEHRLSHHLPWDRSRLCRRPFLGVTALVRRDVFVDALRAADVLLRRHDHDGERLDEAWTWHLPWLLIATRGFNAAYVPAMIATSRASASSSPAPRWLHDVVLLGHWPDPDADLDVDVVEETL